MLRIALAVILGLVVAVAKAEQTIVIDGQDASIKYSTVNNGDPGATWTVVQRSPDSCDTPQMLTSRLGDYMTFTFTGTGVQVVGTIGKKRGDMIFTFDGVNSTFDRSNSVLVCDSVLFQRSGLPYQQHTVMATLVGRAPNYSSGVMDGVISIQRIRYFIPGGSKSNVGAIAGGAVAGALAVFIGAGMIWWFCFRKKRRLRRAPQGAYVDEDDVPAPTGKSASNTPGIVATPFVWSGPGSQYQQTDAPHSYSVSHAPPTPSTTVADHNYQSYPSPHSSPPGVAPSSYFPPVGAGGPRTATYSSSSSDRKRESALSGGAAAAAGFALSNPSSPELVSPHPSSAGGAQSPPADDSALVDRIAHRLADIMQVRTGGVGVLDQIVPPPVYRQDQGGPRQTGIELSNRSPPAEGSSQLPYTFTSDTPPPPPPPKGGYSGY